MEVRVSKNDPVAETRHALVNTLKRSKSRPVLLLLSGGSALAVVNRLSDCVLAPGSSFAMLDERWSIDPTINNFAQLMTTDFYARQVLSGVSFFDSRPGLGESAQALAQRYDYFLHSWRSKEPDGLIIATLGMGTDGHTAGIFPGFVKTFAATDRWVVSYDVPPQVNQFTARITVTPRFLTEEISAAFAIVVGEKKRALLNEITSSTDPEQYPAALWYSLPQIIVFTDI